MTSTKVKIQEAVEIFGAEIIREVLSIVSVADADGAYSTFQDMGMDEHAEAVEMIFFED